MRSSLAKFAAPFALIAALGGMAGCAPQAGPVGYAEPAPQFERRVFPNINFAFDSYRISPADYAQLDAIAIALNDPALNGLRFEINGHTDVTGRLGYNIALSQLRAASVASYLAARGVPRERMRAQGFGPLQLLDVYNPRSPVNRRVEIVALQ